MKSRFLSALTVAAVFLCVAAPVMATSISVTLGGQDYSDGATPTTGAFLTAGTGEPAPFDGVFIGSDVTGPNFSGSWTFSYAVPLGDTITGASLTLGIYDHESAATGSQVASFSLNGGVNLTGNLDTAFEAAQGASRQVKIYTLALPGSAFSALATGSATFALALQGPGLGILGETTFNGAGLDFSSLDITTVTTPPPPTIPEPGSLGLLLAGISSLAALRFARRK